MNPEMSSTSRVLNLFITTIHDLIKIAGDQGIPSGHLYALLMSVKPGVFDLETYTALIDHMVKKQLITNSGHLLKAVK